MSDAIAVTPAITLSQGQVFILDEFNQASNHLRNILDRIYEDRPLNHKNTAAVRDEIKGLLRHIDRAGVWVAECQDEGGRWP